MLSTALLRWKTPMSIAVLLIVLFSLAAYRYFGCGTERIKQTGAGMGDKVW